MKLMLTWEEEVNVRLGTYVSHLVISGIELSKQVYKFAEDIERHLKLALNEMK